MAIPKLDISDLTNQKRLSAGLDKINADQLSGVLAEKAKSVGQAFNEFSDKGIGKFGMSFKQLENGGFLKPGMVDRFVSQGKDPFSILKSPSIWTGKNSISSITQILDSESLQTDIMFDSMENAFSGLKSIGGIVGNETSAALAQITSIASEFDPSKALDWANGKISDASELLEMDKLAEGADYAVNFIDTKATSLVSNIGDSVDDIAGGVSSLFDGLEGTAKTIVPPAVTKTISRESIDSTLKTLVGDQRVQLPDFTGEIPNIPSPILNEFKVDLTQKCRCSDPTLINPTQQECEAASGTWICSDISGTTLT